MITGTKIRRLPVVIGYLLPSLILQIIIVKIHVIGQSLERITSIDIDFFVIAKQSVS
jgi:hypothetical protein